MKTWSISKEKLLEAASVLDLVPTRPGQPSSEFFEVTPKNGHVRFSIAAEVMGVVKLRGSGDWPFEKDFYLDRRVFMPFVNVARDIKSDAPFIFSRQKKRLIVRQGKRKAGFDGQPALAGYGISPSSELKSALDLRTSVKELIYCARECATADTVSPELNCVYLQPNHAGMQIMATNQKIVYRAEAPVGFKLKTPLAFPIFLVALLGSDLIEEIQHHGKYVNLKFPCGQIWQPVSVKASRHFPAADIQKHLEKITEQPLLFSCKATRFAKIINRLCQCVSAVRRQDWVLDIAGEKGSSELVLRVNLSQSAFREIVPLEKPLKKEFNVSWPLDMTQPIFQYVEKMKKGMITVRQSDSGVSYLSTKQMIVAMPRRKS